MICRNVSASCPSTGIRWSQPADRLCILLDVESIATPLPRDASDNDLDAQWVPISMPLVSQHFVVPILIGIGDVDTIETTHRNDSTPYRHCDATLVIGRKDIGANMHHHHHLVPCVSNSFFLQ